MIRSIAAAVKIPRIAASSTWRFQTWRFQTWRFHSEGRRSEQAMPTSSSCKAKSAAHLFREMLSFVPKCYGRSGALPVASRLSRRPEMRAKPSCRRRDGRLSKFVSHVRCARGAPHHEHAASRMSRSGASTLRRRYSFICGSPASPTLVRTCRSPGSRGFTTPCAARGDYGAGVLRMLRSRDIEVQMETIGVVLPNY